MVPEFSSISDLFERAEKPKKLKVSSRIKTDPNSRNMCLEIAQPISKKDTNEATSADFVVTKIDMGPSSHESDIQNFNVMAARMVERSEKDKQSKDQLKQQVHTLSSYLRSIVDTSTMPLSVDRQPIIFTLEGVIEKNVMDNLQKYQAYGKVTEGWVEKVKTLACEFLVQGKSIHDEDLIKKNTIEKDLKNVKSE